MDRRKFLISLAGGAAVLAAAGAARAARPVLNPAPALPTGQIPIRYGGRAVMSFRCRFGTFPGLDLWDKFQIVRTADVNLVDCRVVSISVDPSDMSMDIGLVEVDEQEGGGGASDQPVATVGYFDGPGHETDRNQGLAAPGRFPDRPRSGVGSHPFHAIGAD